MRTFLFISLFLLTVNQCETNYDGSTQEREAGSALPTGKRAHKPFS